MIDLDLISTKILIQEIAKRHKALIVIREQYREENKDWLFIKTQGDGEIGFDLEIATDMLQEVHRHLIVDYLEKNNND